jgi:hypothetical protein
MGHNYFAVHNTIIQCEIDLATQIILAVLTLPYWGWVTERFPKLETQKQCSGPHGGL